MLGLNSHVSGSELTDGGICTTDHCPGRTIFRTLGLVEGMSNGLFKDVQRGGLDGLLRKAKSLMAERASDKGADGILGFRYEIISRDIEKTVLAYGTAVQFAK